MGGPRKRAFFVTIVSFFIFLYETHNFYMTTLVENDLGSFYVNNPDVTFNAASVKLWLKSQYSQELEGPYSALSVDQNDRYAKINVAFPADWDQNHKNGFYTYYIGQGTGANPDILFYQDIVKIITEPGGDAGEVEYISTNEDRESDVYYRPNY